jgi:hypothetical protein
LIALIDDALGLLEEAAMRVVRGGSEVQHWANPLPVPDYPPTQINPMFHHRWGCERRPNSRRPP